MQLADLFQFAQSLISVRLGFFSNSKWTLTKKASFKFCDKGSLASEESESKTHLCWELYIVLSVAKLVLTPVQELGEIHRVKFIDVVSVTAADGNWKNDVYI